MAKADLSTNDGHFARKQLRSKSRLVSWVHQSRFDRAQELVGIYGAGRVVDIGCGDGTFLAMLMQSGNPPVAATGVELKPADVADCRARYGDIENLEFVTRSDAFVDDNERAFDTVICMEVLEHVIGLDEAVRDLARLTKPGGRVIISVPVETGLPLVAKQTLRTVLGWRGVGDYPGITPYTSGELWKSIFAGPQQHIIRPELEEGGLVSYDHKGFNWRVLKRLLDQSFRLEQVTGTPIPWLPPSISSQVWFVGTLKS
jgi:SAM-dependent methyltransferase